MPEPGLLAILRAHVSRYPALEIQDLVKLVHQNEFGPHHLIAASHKAGHIRAMQTVEAESLRRLENEVDSLVADPAGLFDHPDSAVVKPGGLFESIGNRLCRIYLGQLKGSGIYLPTVNRFFLATAAHCRGTRAGFQKKLRLLRDFLDESGWPQGSAGLAAFLAGYDFQICPPIGHSATYQEKYHPAYRVVDTVFRDAFDAFVRLESLLANRSHTIVAIDGMCGAGKSTLASSMHQVFGGTVIAMDHFFLPAEQKTAERLQEAGGNVDYERFTDEVLPGLLANEVFKYRPYDCARQDYGKTRTVRPGRLHIVEGSYSLHPKLGQIYDMKIFMTVNAEEQIRRIRRRNRPELVRRFLEEWIPLEERYFKTLHIARICDLQIQSGLGRE